MMPTLREQAIAKVQAAELELMLYRPKHSLDPARLVDGEGLPPWVNAIPVAGNIADAISTDVALRRGGAREANPVIAAVLNRAGVPAFYVLKVAVGVGTAMLADRIAERRPGLARVIAGIGGAIPAAAAVHNVRGMRRLVAQEGSMGLSAKVNGAVAGAARAIGIRYLLSQIRAAAEGRLGTTWQARYWWLAGRKRWISLTLGILAVIVDGLAGQREVAVAIATAAGVMLSAGVIDATWRQEVPSEVRENAVYRFLAAHSALLATGLAAAAAAAQACTLPAVWFASRTGLECSTQVLVLGALSAALAHLGLIDVAKRTPPPDPLIPEDSWTRVRPLPPAALVVLAVMLIPSPVRAADTPPVVFGIAGTAEVSLSDGERKTTPGIALSAVGPLAIGNRQPAQIAFSADIYSIPDGDEPSLGSPSSWQALRARGEIRVGIGLLEQGGQRVRTSVFGGASFSTRMGSAPAPLTRYARAGLVGVRFEEEVSGSFAALGIGHDGAVSDEAFGPHLMIAAAVKIPHTAGVASIGAEAALAVRRIVGVQQRDRLALRLILRPPSSPSSAPAPLVEGTR